MIARLIAPARALAPRLALVLGAGLVLAGLAILCAGPPRAAAAIPADGWLGEINLYRAAAGLPAVTDNRAWDAGLEDHLAYLAGTPAPDLTGPYASMHTENPASRYYTSAGAQAAGSSDLLKGGATTGISAIDRWLAAPFHAVGMLRAQVSEVALAVDPATGDAGLDVIQGIDWSLPPAGSPILFPGPGMTTDLSTYSGAEYPDPLETCGWTGSAFHPGLPLVALLTRAPASGLHATLSGPSGTESSAAGNLCIVDQSTYRSTDPVYGPNGRKILQADHAVFLIPEQPLDDGGYSVRLQQPDRPDVDWAFSVGGAVVAGPARSLITSGPGAGRGMDPGAPAHSSSTTGLARLPAGACRPCVDRSHPAALWAGAASRTGRRLVITLTGIRRFSAVLRIIGSGLPALFTHRRSFAAGPTTITLLLPEAPRTGTRVTITASLVVGRRRVLARRRIRILA